MLYGKQRIITKDDTGIEGDLFCLDPIVPNLEGVDDVLPEDIATWADRCDRIEIHARHPDGESGVLLP